MLNFFSKNEYRQIGDVFNLGVVRSIKYFRKGFQTPKVKILTPKGEFIVSKHKHFGSKNIWSKSRKSFQYEIDLLSLLKDLPVPHYLRAKNGNYVLDFKGFDVTVYKFLRGKQPRSLTSAMMYQLGKFVGDFHVVGRRFKKSLKGRRQFYNLTAAIIKKMNVYARRQTNHELKSVVAEVKNGVEVNRLPKTLPRGPIHVDIKPENELFVGEKLTGVIDFGNFYIGPYMLDIGKTIMWNCVKNGRLDEKSVRSFLRGYRSQRKLNFSELKYVKKAILFAIFSHIWVDLYHVPIKYVPESYTLFLVKNFLPVAGWLEKHELKI